LDLSANGLDGATASQLLQVMRGMKLLTRVDLSKNAFVEAIAGKTGVAKSFKELLLAKTCGLKHLSLAGCKLGDSAVRTIAMAIGASPCSLETLDLSDNQIDGAAQAIAACVLGKPGNGLVSLDLSWNNIRAWNAVALGERLAGRGPPYRKPNWHTGPEPLEVAPKPPQIRRHYDWSLVDTTDLVHDQEALRKHLHLAANDVDGLDEQERKSLFRHLRAQRVSPHVISQIKQLVDDGEVDLNDREFLLSVAPPDSKKNLAYLTFALEQMEAKLIALFRQYCYTVSGGRSGENLDPDAVSAEQFKQFARDCGMANCGEGSVDKTTVDQIFLRAMFNRNPKPAHDSLEPQADHCGSADLDTRQGKGTSTTLGSGKLERALGMYEFVGAVLRLADRRYSELLAQGLAGKLKAFYDEVLDHLHGLVDNADSLPLARPVRVVLTHHEKHLKQLFDCFKKGDKASGDVQRAGRADGRTMSVDEFETFCAAASICPDMLPYSDPRTIFVALNLDDDLYEQEDKYLLRTAL
jgi:hypothetical protein